MIGIRHIILAVVLLASFPACDTHEQQDDFAEDASRPPSGYTRTDEGGSELSVDEDDWRTAPVYAGQISIRAAFPNPVSSSDFVTVPVTVTSFGEVRAPLRLEARHPDDPNLLFELDDIERATDPGAYDFNFSAAVFQNEGLHRVYIFDGVGEIVSYGDIMVE